MTVMMTREHLDSSPLWRARPAYCYFAGRSRVFMAYDGINACMKI